MKRLKSPTGRARECRQQKFPKGKVFLFNLASVRKMLVLPDESKRTKTETVLYKFHRNLFRRIKMNNFIFVGVFIVVMACTPFALLAKENGTEECDAALKEVLAQAKQVTASAVFLRGNSANP